MGIADRAVEELTSATQEFVGSGKDVEVALNGSGRNLWLVSGLLGFVFGRPRILAATMSDLQLLGVGTGKSWVRVTPTSVIATYPRDTTVGPPKGVLSHKVRFPDGQKIYLHRMHFDRIRQIDAGAPAS
jgi:hypothetical protein